MSSQQQQPTSFNQVLNLVSEQISRNSIEIDPTKAVLAMVTRLGQVAGFCGDKFATSNNSTNNKPVWSSLNNAEQRELRSHLGDLSVALFAVATTCGIDLGDATMQSLGYPSTSNINNNNTNENNNQYNNNTNNNNQRSQSSAATNYTAGSSSIPHFHHAQSQQGSIRNPQQQGSQSQQQQQQMSAFNSVGSNNNNNQQQQQHQDVSLNPHSISNIRQFITSIRSLATPLSEEDFANIGLVFAYEDPNNNNNTSSLIPLCQNGERIRVNPSNFDEFVKLFFDQIARIEAGNNNNSSQSPNRSNQTQQHSTPPRQSAFHAPAHLSQEALENRNNTNGNNNGNNNGGGLTSPGMRPSNQPNFEGEVVGHEDGAVIRRIQVDKTGHPNLNQEMACYSPSHQTFGLFSPQAKGDTIDVAYPEPDSPATGPQRSLPNNNENTNGSQQQQQQDFGLNSPQAPNATIAFPQLSLPESQQQQGNQQQQRADQSESSNNTTPAPAVVSRLANQGNNGQPSFPPMDPITVASSEDHFNPRFLHLERVILDVEDQLAAIGKRALQIRQSLSHYLPKEEIEALSLVFAIPFKNKPFELTESGQYMRVTHQNAKEYVTLVRDQRAIFEGRLSKKQSVKTFAVHLPHGGDPGRETGGFQTHTRAGDLTAPPDSKTTFTFDTENDESLVPKVLQREKLPILLPSASHYVAYLSTHPERFPEMFRIMRQKPDMLSRWNVAYVVPDPDGAPPHSLQHATEHSARRCGVRELVHKGAGMTVREQDIDEYVNLVLRVAPQLPGCLQPSP